MNRIMLSALIAIVAFAGNTTDCYARTISKGKTKKVSAYFSSVLNGESAAYKGTDRIKPGSWVFICKNTVAVYSLKKSATLKPRKL